MSSDDLRAGAVRVAFNVSGADAPLSGAARIEFHIEADRRDVLPRALIIGFPGGVKSATPVRATDGGESQDPDAPTTSDFWVGINTHLLPDGPVAATFRLDDGDGQPIWSATAQLEIANSGPLAAQVKASLRRAGTPLIVEEFRASDYGYDDASLAPWFDRGDAAAHIARLQSAGQITAAEAQKLGSFVADGFVILEDTVDDELVDLINGEIDDAIAQKREGYEYGSSQRLHNLHQFYPGVRRLWQHATIMRYLQLIFDSAPRPCQTLTYIFGSQQSAHQDTIHLTPFPAGYMCGVWVALEDVRPDSGELVVFRGSHRLPRVYMHSVACAKVRDGNWKEFGDTVANRWEEMLQSTPHERIIYRPRRGEVLIWHENLMHGGSLRVDHSLSRRSIVSHVFADGGIAFYDSNGHPGYMHPLPRAGTKASDQIPERSRLWRVARWFSPKRVEG